MVCVFPLIESNLAAKWQFTFFFCLSKSCNGTTLNASIDSLEEAAAAAVAAIAM